MAATVYASALGGDWNNDLTTWVTTDGGATPANHPVAGDTANLTGNGGQITVNVASACAVINCTGYTNTLTVTNGITVSGNVTLPDGVGGAVSGTGTLTMHATGALKANGLTWGGALTFDAAVIYTISGAAIVTGLVSFNTGAGGKLNFTTAVGTDTLTCNGGLTFNADTSAGTAKFVIGGGTLQCDATTYRIRNPVDFAGTVTLGAIVATVGSNITYVSGTVDSFTNSSTLYLGTSATLNTPSTNMQWFNITVNVSSTLALTSKIQIGDATHNGTFTSSVNTGTTTLATSGIDLYGSLTATGILNGIGLTITMMGTGTWSGAQIVQTNITFNTAGTITISGNVYYSTGTLTYTAGTITVTGSTLNVGTAATTLNTSGMSWNNVTSTMNGTLTLTSALDVNGNLTHNATTSCTLATSNITVAGNLTISSTGTIGGTGRTITMDGTGTWSHASTGSVTANLTFNTAGTITISGTVNYSTQTLTYTAGTMVVTSSTLNLKGNETVTTNGMSWNNVTVSGGTATLGNAIDINGNLQVDATRVIACGTYQVNLAGNLSVLNTSKTAWRTGNNTFVFDGTTTISTNATALGATFYNFTIADGATVHLTSTETYAATGTFTAAGSVGTPITFDAVTASSAALFNPTSVGTVTYVVATDIDSSGGTAVVDTNGTLTRTVNWSTSAAVAAVSDYYLLPLVGVG